MKNRKWIVHVVVLGALLLFSFSPLLVALSAGAFASANGCELHEGFVNPCVVGGTDYGETLYSLGVMGWFGMVTLPLGLLLAGLYVVVVLVVWIIRRKRASRQAAG